MKTYLIKLAMRGITPMITRRLKVPGNISIADLHHAIQVVYQWDNDYLHQFHIHGKDFGISYVGGIGFFNNPHRVYLNDFEFDIGDKFTYEYNFFDHWIIDIRVEKIEKSDGTDDKPRCIKGAGMFGADKCDEHEAIINLLKAIVNANDKATVEEIRPLIDKLNSVRFNRNLINNRLKYNTEDI